MKPPYGVFLLISLAILVYPSILEQLHHFGFWLTLFDPVEDKLVHSFPPGVCFLVLVSPPYVAKTLVEGTNTGSSIDAYGVLIPYFFHT